MIVNSNLRKAQLSESELLKKFKHICDCEGFQYYLLGGTVLGAVRHGGFIPWDDDIDAALLREDYDRFIEAAPKYLTNGEELLHYSLSEEYTDYTMKLIDRNTLFVLKRENTTIRQNIWIDIFPIDGTPNYEIGRKMHYLRLDYLRMLLAFHYIKNIRIDENRSVIKRVLVKLAQKLPIGKLVNPTRIKQRIDTEFRKYPVAESNFIGNYMGAYHEREIFPRAYFAEGELVEFEGEAYRVPKETDKYLQQQYGDYMKFPPKEEQVPKHHIIEIQFIN